MSYWKRIDASGKTTTVESYSHNLKVKGALVIDEVEFDAYIKALPITSPEPTRDLAAEIDALKAQVAKLVS